MKNFPIRMPLILLIGWLVVMLVTVANAQDIIVSTSEGPAARPLPQYVQGLSDADYAQWARWQNATAERASESNSRSQSPYLTGIQTTTTMTSRNSGWAQRGNRYGEAQVQGRTSGNARSLTLPVRVRNPGYQTKALTVYNPFCRPKANPNLEPDWDNLYCIKKSGRFSHRVVSVATLADDPDFVPLPLEALFEFQMTPYFGDTK